MHDILVKTTHLLASSLELWGACDPDRGLSQPELLLQAQAGGSLYRGRQVFFFFYFDILGASEKPRLWKRRNKQAIEWMSK